MDDLPQSLKDDEHMTSRTLGDGDTHVLDHDDNNHATSDADPTAIIDHKGGEGLLYSHGLSVGNGYLESLSQVHVTTSPHFSMDVVPLYIYAESLRRAPTSISRDTSSQPPRLGSNNDEGTDQGDHLYQCGKCTSRFCTRKDLDRHLHIHDLPTHGISEPLFRCRCGRENRRKDNFHRHLLGCQYTPTQDYYSCICGNTETSKQNMFTHFAACGRKLRRGRGLRRALADVSSQTPRPILDAARETGEDGNI